MTTDVLRRLDLERRASGDPSTGGTVFREYSPDLKECLIAYSCNTAEEIDDVIHNEIARAEARRYNLEWKVYGHDSPLNLKNRLSIAGFDPQPVESLMALCLTEAAMAAFDAPEYDIKTVHDTEGLNDVAAISRETGRANVDEEKTRLALTLQNAPDKMSVYVAYVHGEAAACGRIYFNEGGGFAELCGGRTKTTHRNRGLYTALVVARLREALERNCEYVIVDALPTSEPILKKRGFRFITDTQPFLYRLRS